MEYVSLDCDGIGDSDRPRDAVNLQYYLTELKECSTQVSTGAEK